MSGVNAHILVLPPAGSAGHRPVGQSGQRWALPWEQQRYWPVPPQHRLLQLPRPGAAKAGEARFAAYLSTSAGLAYLWDHQVAGGTKEERLLYGCADSVKGRVWRPHHSDRLALTLVCCCVCPAGRPLLAGTAMLEMAAAAAATLAESVLQPSGSLATSTGKGMMTLTVAGSSFVSPCVLPEAGAGGLVLLECTVGSRSGSLAVQSASGSRGAMATHLTGQSAAVAQQQRPSADGQHTFSGPGASAICMFLPAAAAQQPITQGTAGIKQPTADFHAAYYQHPAAADSTLHLSALISQQLGGTSESSRIPVAAGLYQCPTRVRTSSASTAAVAVSLPSAVESLTGVSCREDSGESVPAFSLVNLLARDLPSRKQVKQPRHLTYEVQWQATAAVPPAVSANAAAQPLLSAFLAAGEAVHIVKTAGLPHGHPILAAAQLLRVLQSDNATRSAVQWQLGHAALGSLEPLSHQQKIERTASSMLHAVLRVAAAEHLLDPRASVISTDGSGAAGPDSGADLGSKQFGAVLSARTAYAPLLLPASPQQRHSAAGLNAPALQGAMIIGGLGGLGLLTTGWLAASVAAAHPQHNLLLGRSGRVAGDTAAALINASTSASITMRLCDVAMSGDAAAATSAAAAVCPLSAVLHAGGVLADAAILNQTAAKLRLVTAAKVVGLSRLATAAAAQPLQQLLLFSSIAAPLGTAGQAPYAAANAALDSAAALLQQLGSPGTSIQWGAWAGAGMAAAEPTLLRRLEQQGYGAVQPAHGLAALQAMLAPAPAPVSMASPFDWSRFLRQSSRQQLPFFAEVKPSAALTASGRGAAAPVESMAVHVTRQVAAAAVATPAASLPNPTELLPVLQQLLADLVGVAAGADTPLLEAGLDSIGAIELRSAAVLVGRVSVVSVPATPTTPHLGNTRHFHLPPTLLSRNAIGEIFHLQPPATLSFDHPTLASLAAYVASELAAAARAEAPEGARAMAPSSPGPTPEDLLPQLLVLVEETAGVVAVVDQPLMEVGPISVPACTSIICQELCMCCVLADMRWTDLVAKLGACRLAWIALVPWSCAMPSAKGLASRHPPPSCLTTPP